MIALGLVAAGVILGLVGFRLTGGLIAGSGAIPSLYGTWAGMQQETQTGLAASLGVLFLCLGVGAILIVWKVFGAIF
jgi:hypothetical protein